MTPIGPVNATKIPRLHHEEREDSPGCPGSSEVPARTRSVWGIPFDSGVSYRPGTRFGPSTYASSRLCGPTTPRRTPRPSRSQQVADAGDTR